MPLYRERLADVEPDGALLGRRCPLAPVHAQGRPARRHTRSACSPCRGSRSRASTPRPGTTGKPTVVGYTAADLDVFARVVARCLAMAGAEPGMTLHNAYGYGLFTGGLGLHDGGTTLGLTVVPVSGGMTERQLTLILDLRPDVIACTPSYALDAGAGLPRSRRRGPTRSASASRPSAPSPGRSACGTRSTRASACAARTSSGSPRSSGRASPASAPRSAPGCT